MKIFYTVPGKTRNSGFSLVEVMLGTLLLAILAIGGAAARYHTGSGIVIQGHYRDALVLANEALEVARQTDYSNLDDSQYTRGRNGHNFTVDTEVTTVSNPWVAVQMKNVVVTVTYSDRILSVQSLVIRGVGFI
jgi:prepilin-type N-terminal cleavage/methylation domain-containing protein